MKVLLFALLAAISYAQTGEVDLTTSEVASGGTGESGDANSTDRQCNANDVDRTDVCSPRVCDSNGAYYSIEVECNYSGTPCSCCGTCENLGVYLRGPVSILKDNPDASTIFLSECSAKLHPARCLAIDPKFYDQGVLHVEFQANKQQLGQVRSFLATGGFSLPSFIGPYSVVHPLVPHGPAGGGANGGGSGSGSVPQTTSAIGNMFDAPAGLTAPRMCAMQTRQECYGAALTTEGEPSVCGWSPQGMCGAVLIDEEPSEGDICHMKLNFWTCFGMANGGSSDRICVWNPTFGRCVGGELDQEPGDGPAMPPAAGAAGAFNSGAFAGVFDQIANTYFGAGAGNQMNLQQSHSQDHKSSFDWRVVTLGTFGLLGGFLAALSMKPILQKN